MIDNAIEKYTKNLNRHKNSSLNIWKIIQPYWKKSKYTTPKYDTLAYWLFWADPGRAFCFLPTFLKTGHKFPVRNMSSPYQKGEILFITRPKESMLLWVCTKRSYLNNLNFHIFSSIFPNFPHILPRHFPTIYWC